MGNIIFFWFRRDLRLHDNAGLYHSLKRAKKEGATVVPVFIFDPHILKKLPEKYDRRVDFIYQNLEKLQEKLTKKGSTLIVQHGTPEEVWKKLIKEFSKKHKVVGLYLNHDYEPYAITRDSKIEKLCKKENVDLKTFKDHVIFEKDEVTKDDGTPYTVYTPYMKKCRKTHNDFYLREYPTQKYWKTFWKSKSIKLPPLKDIGFEKTGVNAKTPKLTPKLIEEYHKVRDIPTLDACTHLGIHLRFGTVSIRELMNFALVHNDTFANELMWREFFMQILWHFPHVIKGAFRPKYDKVKWLNNKADFKKWCEGRTGFPIVDAGMRELNATGYMHNRVRMITASFLVKDLLIDWKWGEKYFADKLLDFELASNNGNWQWAAGTGCDAAPYFRIFNPTSQQQKFDPDLTYIKKWIPEFDTPDYPKPMLDHKLARERTLDAYKKAVK